MSTEKPNPGYEIPGLLKDLGNNLLTKLEEVEAIEPNGSPVLKTLRGVVGDLKNGGFLNEEQLGRLF